MLRIDLRLVASALAVCLLTWSCNSEPTAPSAPSHSQVKRAPAPKLTPAKAGSEGEAEAAPPKYVYDDAGRRDPFENPLQGHTPVGPEDESALTPLQKIDLGQLRLIGIIIGRGEPAAMVVGPGGKSYILKKGVKVGKNDGVVVGIDAEMVKIQEKFYDFSGELRTRDQELQLPKREGVN